MPTSSTPNAANAESGIPVNLGTLNDSIRWGLQQLRTGDLFVKIGLVHADFSKILLEDTHRKRFWSIVADHVLEQGKHKEEWNKHDKRRHKAILNMLETHKSIFLNILQGEYSKLTTTTKEEDVDALEVTKFATFAVSNKNKKKQQKKANQENVPPEAPTGHTPHVGEHAVDPKGPLQRSRKIILNDSIRWGLQQLRAGNLFAKIGLVQTDFVKFAWDDTRRKRFWSIVADHYLEHGKTKEEWNKHDKQRRDAILNVLEKKKYIFLDILQDEYSKLTTALEDTKPSATFTTPVKNERELKKKAEATATTGHAPHDDDNKRLQQARLKIKIEFERKKNQILSRVPQATRDMFSQIYFSRWRKCYLPVLVVSPYDVPPGPIRQNWMSMYHKLKGQGRLQNMTNLCFWLGTIDTTLGYSLLPTKSLIPYGLGVKKNYHKLPASIATKLENGKQLSTSDSLHVRALYEMKEDLQREPHQRKRGIIDFPEEYDLVTMSDLEEPATTDALGDNESEKEGTVSKANTGNQASNPPCSLKPKRNDDVSSKRRRILPMQDDDAAPKKPKTEGTSALAFSRT